MNMKIKDVMIKGIDLQTYHYIIFELFIGGRSNSCTIGED